MTRLMKIMFLLLWSCRSSRIRLRQMLHAPQVAKCHPPWVRCVHDPSKCCRVVTGQSQTQAAFPQAGPRVTSHAPLIRQLKKLFARQFNDGDAVQYSSSRGSFPAKIVAFHPTTGLYDLLMQDRVLRNGIPADKLIAQAGLQKHIAVAGGGNVIKRQHGHAQVSNVQPGGIPRPSCTSQRQPEGGADDGPLVVAMGDSLTEGRDAACPGQIKGSCLWWGGSCASLGLKTKEQAKIATCAGEMDPWPSQLQRMIPSYKVLNRGCYGQTLEQMIDRVRNEIPQQIQDRVAVVSVMAGTNNLWGANASQHYVMDKLTELHAIIKRELAPQSKLIVMTIPQGGPGQIAATSSKVQAINQFLKQTYSNKEQDGLYFVDTYTGLDYAGLDRTGHPMMYDNTHFGPDGYAQIAERVFASGAFE